jgi:O-antigen/teichoic acid export membrane protein
MFWRHYALTLKPVLSDMGEGKTASFYNTSRIRQNLPYFISGRLVSALGTFGSMVLIVRALSVADFGVFSIIVGSSIIFGMVCGLGIERLIPRYLSELRSAGMLGRAAYLAWLLLLARIILLLPAFLILYYLWDLVGNQLQVELDMEIYWASIAYIGAFLVSKQAADTLQAVMNHREAAFGYAVDAAVRLLMLVFFAIGQSLSLLPALWAYVAGASAGAAICIVGMLRLFSTRVESPFQGGKQNISPAALVRYGWHAYLHNVGGILLTPQALRIFCATLLGAAGVAALGFAQSMTDFVKRYLPVFLVGSMIEPILIGRYRESRDFAVLNRLAAVILKVNLFLLLPFVGWLALSGDGALALITGGKYLKQSWLLVGLLILLAFDAHRALLHTIIMAVDATWLLVVSQVWPTVMLVGLLALVYYEGLGGLLAGLTVIVVFVNYFLILQLRKCGHAYRLDWRGIVRIAVNAAAGSFLGMLVSWSIGGWLGSLLAAVVVCIVYLGIGYWHKVFGPDERNLINKLIGRPIWVW